jgi:NAD(P)H-flavin reductase/ferredoxin
MRKTHQVTINGEQFLARHGDLLLDSALMNGIHIPHDCRVGYCGSCCVRIVAGELFGEGDEQEAKACQCRVISDVEIEVEIKDLPDLAVTDGRVAALKPLAPDIVELCIDPQEPVEYLPGQYLQVQFRRFAARCYSPTVALDRSDDDDSIHLHVRRIPGGHVSAALGTTIEKGHRVKLKGPFGSAYLRSGLDNRLVLVAGGTGFAPIWSIAAAAMRENPKREVTLVVGARSLASLYMIPALWRLAACPNVTIVPVTDIEEPMAPVIRVGSPVGYLPPLNAHDVVYAAGPSPLVDRVTAAAKAAGARWYADAFVPSGGVEDGLLARATSWLRGDPQVQSPAARTRAVLDAALVDRSRASPSNALHS